MKKFGIALLTGAALAAGGLTTAARADDVTIAVAGPMTGDEAVGGEQLKRGAELAVKDINAKGGVMGKMLKLDVEDDACDPKQAVAVANKIASAGIKFVDGHYCSGSSIPASAVYHDEGIVQITPGSTNPKLTEEAAAKGWKNVFRTVGRDDAQGKVAGAYLAAHYKDKKVAILDDKSAYGEGLANETEKNFKAAGGTVALRDHINAGEKDYSAVVGKLKAAGIDVLYYGGYHAEFALITRQSRDAGYKETLISADDTPTAEFWKVTGPAGEGVLFTFPPDPRNNPAAKDAVAEFKKDGFDPEAYTLYSYASVQVWSQAVASAKSFDSAKVEDAIHGHSFNTVVGTLKINDKGDVIDPAYVFYSWHDGNYAELK
jgi:branched-chain amino acid transport system substrate-binding protein